jgi:hypothetical protein
LLKIGRDEAVRILNALSVLCFGSHWWGTPDFDQRLERPRTKYAPQLTPGDRAVAIASPDTVTEEFFTQLSSTRAEFGLSVALTGDDRHFVPAPPLNPPRLRADCAERSLRSTLAMERQSPR